MLVEALPDGGDAFDDRSHVTNPSDAVRDVQRQQATNRRIGIAERVGVHVPQARDYEAALRQHQAPD